MTMLVNSRAAATAATEISEPRLAGRRAEIDCIDDAILRLIDMRLRLAERIGAAKSPDAPRRRPEREAEILARLTAAREVAPEGLVETVWRAIMAESLARQG